MKRVLVWVVIISTVMVPCVIWLFWASSPEGEGGRRVAGFFRRGKKSGPVTVETVRPGTQSFERICVQPGSLTAYESVDLYAEASGLLKTLKVDLGDRVQQGDLLAVIDVPELRKQKEKAEAQLLLAKARVDQAKKGVLRAIADRKVARATVPKAEAQLAALRAARRYRVKQFNRIKDLFEQKGVEERLVDEAEERKDAALAAEQAGILAVETAQAQMEAAEARLEQTKADVAEAQANEQIAVAEVGRIDVLVGFAQIVAPFPAVVTRRNVFPGAFIRSAKEGGNLPLLSLERVDKVRAVVQIPDRDVPFADVGDKAIVEIDTLRGKRYEARISRTQGSEDPQTRTMRIEIDLDNKSGELRPGMYGKVTIGLEKSAGVLTLPSACLVGESKDGLAAVYVVRDAKAALVPIKIGSENGLLVEVLSGLTDKDLVIRRFSGILATGTPVRLADETQDP